MAEGGPYGITQFDAAGVLNNYQAMQSNRIQMMLQQKQLERLDKQTQDEDAASKAISAYYVGSTPPSATSGTSSGASGASPPATPADPLAPLPAAPSAPASPSPATSVPDAAARERLIGTLMATAPEQASKFVDMFSNMDKTQATQVQQRNLQFMQGGAALLQLPAAQRPAALQQMAPQLQQLGVTPEQLARFDTSDQGLRSFIAQHTDLDHIMQFVKPDITPVTQGGSLVQTDPTGASHTIYETPTVTVGQNVYSRPAAMRTTPPPPAIEHLRAHPELAPAFDQKYGAGAAARELGGQTAAPSGTFPQ